MTLALVTTAPTAADLAASVFTSSTRETRPDWCDSVGSWRVAHRDALAALAGTILGLDDAALTAAVYVEGHSTTKAGRGQLWVGPRDEVNRPALVVLAREFKALGLKVRIVTDSGLVRGLVVTDRLTNKEA